MGAFEIVPAWWTPTGVFPLGGVHRPHEALQSDNLKCTRIILQYQQLLFSLDISSLNLYVGWYFQKEL